MSDVMQIGTYQLENLLSNGVKFHYFDLRPAALRATETSALLTGSVPVVPEKVLETAREVGVGTDAPFVLICENGVKSLAMAELLAQNSFINVFVVLGGTKALAH